MLSFKPAFSLSSSTCINRLFGSSLLSAIRVLSCTYLKLLIFLPAILILVCDSSSPALHIMYSVYKLNKQGDNIQPWRTPFLIWNQSVVPCLLLTVASWPAYRCFSGGRSGGLEFPYLEEFPVCCDPPSQRLQKQMCFWNSLAFSMIQWMLAIWSLVPLPFLNPACTSGSPRFPYYWSLAWRILSITLLACEMSAILW